MNPMRNISFVSVDVETGGLNENLHSILEIGMVTVVNDEIVKELNLKIRHDSYNMTAIAQKINGTYDLIEHENGSLTAKEALIAIKEYIQEMTILNNNKKLMPLGHNTQFDVRFLKKLFKDFGEDFEDYFDYHLFDLNTEMMALYSFGFFDILPSNGDKASIALGLPKEVTPHRAINGARRNVEVYFAAKKTFEDYLNQLKNNDSVKSIGSQK